MLQSEAFEMMKMGWNVFLTGPAGCGKTFLMNKYIEYLKDHGVDVAVTATTGLAATHLNGRTIHSWCGMGIEPRLTRELIEALKEKELLYFRIRYAKVHKSQGMSLDCAEIDLSKTFEYGMGYVALSRVRSLAGMNLVGINPKALEVNGKVLELDVVFRRKSFEDRRIFLSMRPSKWKQLQEDFVKRNKEGVVSGGIFEVVDE